MNDKTPQFSINNKDYLIINKPAGLLSISGLDENSPSVQEIASKKFKKPIQILTRLDRPVSGLMLVAKGKFFKKHYIKEQQEGNITKTYICMVEGKWDSKHGFLEHYHYHDRKHRKARITNDFLQKETKVSLHYEILSTLEKYTVLLITIKSGKFHQIRAQLAKAGYPVKGDVKYGAKRSNKDRSIHLHAYKINFTDLRKRSVEHKVELPQHDTLWKLASEALSNK